MPNKTIFYNPGGNSQSNAPRQQYNPNQAEIQRVTNFINNYLARKNLAGTPVAQHLLAAIPIISNYYQGESLSNDNVDQLVNALQSGQSGAAYQAPANVHKGYKVASEIRRNLNIPKGPLAPAVQGISPAAQAGTKEAPQRKQTSNYQPQQPAQPSGLAAINQGQPAPAQPQPQQPALTPQQKWANAINKYITDNNLGDEPYAAILSDPRTVENIVKTMGPDPDETRIGRLFNEGNKQVKERNQAREQEEELRKKNLEAIKYLRQADDVLKEREKKKGFFEKKVSYTDEDRVKIEELLKKAEDAVKGTPYEAGTKGSADRVRNEVRVKPSEKEGKKEANPPVAPAANPAERPINVNNNADPRNNPEAVTTTETETAETEGEGGGGGNEPAVAAQATPEAIVMGDRMTDLLGQIKRTSRRATPYELDQINKYYKQIKNVYGDNVPTELKPVLDRVARDYNQYARLLDVPYIGVGVPQSQSAELGVPTDQLGNVDLQAYRRQFPQFFSADRDRPALKNEDQIQFTGNTAQKAAQRAQYKKIRSDINQINWANNIAEVGYPLEMDKNGRLKYPNRKDEMAALKEADAIYRESDEYRNTVLPEGAVSRSFAKQHPDLAPQTQTYQVSQHPTLEMAATGNRASSRASTGTPSGGTPSLNPAGQATRLEGPELTAAEKAWGGPMTLHQIPIFNDEQLQYVKDLQKQGFHTMLGALQPPTEQPAQQQQATTSLQNALNLLQRGDVLGAQQELALAGGPGYALNAPTGFNVLNGPLNAQQVAPMDAGQIREAIQQMQAIDDRAFQEGGVEGARPYTPEEQQTFNQLYAQVAGQDPQALTRFQEQLHNFKQRYTGQQPQAQTAPQNFAPQGVQQGRNQPTNPVANVLNRVGDAAQAGVGMANAGGNIWDMLRNLPAGGRNAWAQGPAAFGQWAAGQGAAFMNNLGQMAGEGGNIANAVGGRPARPVGAAAGGGGAPGLNYPGAGGFNALMGGGAPYNQGYNHPMPYTAANEINRFYQQTVPTLAERFTALGGGGQRTAAFQGALGGAGRDLGLGLAAQGEQQQLQNQQLGFNQNLLLRQQSQNEKNYAAEQQRRDTVNRFNLGQSAFGTVPPALVNTAIQPPAPGIVPVVANAVGGMANAAVNAALKTL